MVRVGDALGAAAASVGLTVTRFISYSEKNGLPPLNVLYTSDEDQAWYFLKNRLNSTVLGLDMQWKPVLKGKPTSRSSLLQVAAGDWVLIYDVLPTPWYGTPAQPLSDRMCEFFEEKGRTFYGMILPVDAARMAFELDCVISRGVDLRKNAWRGANTTGGMVHLGNQILGTTVREDRKVAISNWEWRPLTGQQLRYMAEKTYISWAIADYFLKKKGRPSKNATVTKAQIYGGGARLRKAGHAIQETKHDWTRAKKQWLREVKLRKEQAEAEEAAAAEAEKAEKKRRARQTKTKKSSKAAADDKPEKVAADAKTEKRRRSKASKAAPEPAKAESRSKKAAASDKETKSSTSRKAKKAAEELTEAAAQGKQKRGSKKPTAAATAAAEKKDAAAKQKKRSADQKSKRKQALAASA